MSATLTVAVQALAQSIIKACKQTVHSLTETKKERKLLSEIAQAGPGLNVGSRWNESDSTFLLPASHDFQDVLKECSLPFMLRESIDWEAFLTQSEHVLPCDALKPALSVNEQTPKMLPASTASQNELEKLIITKILQEGREALIECPLHNDSRFFLRE